MYERLDEAILRYLRRFGCGAELYRVHDAVENRFGTPWGNTSALYERVRRRLYALRKKGLISYLPGQGWVAIQQ